ncbi:MULTISPECIES: hypothetical protein [Shewanella]|uniref:PilZ domain-containing protein n=1 Tax=Shewanella putrefaciens (strain CN-32 / ATCC BAA-453) TaxID=319224 RepID=A4Y7E5_SHEPC|nr:MULTISPECIES: hypothetical protein [Shewanella]ABM24689.1 conserved hypothetical protein [Shewanella sp. W3-18-1]MCK7634091.1 hypothetical protein [Shewanella sp. JNE17]MCK7649316.1 hypothetical protein [Shewanella sp. JNE8]MCK7657529.1 hypothetical protein [Shewanella sp. JNE4-2]QGS49704.1 hypothetical protein FOB89_12725 [Shewanella putrefaciens]
MFTDSNPYFSVPHPFTAYLSAWPQSQPVPSEIALRSMQSLGIQLLSEVKELEANCLLQLRHIDNEAKAVVDFLKLQSRKVDLVLQHVLEKETQEGDKFQGCQFGGSSIRLISPSPLPLGAQYKTTLFIHDELVAILCFAKVVASNPDTRVQNDGDPTAEQYFIDLEFSQILESDIEQLVKASLNVQQKQLKLRKLARDGNQ